MFVVLGCVVEYYCFVVVECEDGDFFVLYEFFDYQCFGGVVEFVGEEFIDFGFGFFVGGWDDYVFVGCQIVSFEYIGWSELVQKGFGFCCVGENVVVCGWYVVVGIEIFGEGFGGFQYGGCFGWFENGDISVVQFVC